MMDRHAARLLDKRFDEEEAAANAELSYKATFREGPPPNAQLVFNPGYGIGVAVKGARFVCPLPKGYQGQGLALALIDKGRLIVTHPDLPPLVIDPHGGVTTPL